MPSALRPTLRAALLAIALGAAPRTLHAQPGTEAAPPQAGSQQQPPPTASADSAAPAPANRPAPRVMELPDLSVSARDAAAVAEAPERWEEISPEAANGAPARLPLGPGSQGPAVLRVQILLNRALFSPGMIDGRWGKNTQQALLWLQRREGLAATGQVDSATLGRLTRLAGGPARVVRPHVLSAPDVQGPFVRIPTDIYQHAKLPCSCYQSLTEKLSELFHVTPEVLRKLNPGTDLDKVAAGATINVPHVRAPDARARGEVRELVVSGTGNYLQALDASGRILYHFPTTLGSSFDPSPAGDFQVRAVSDDPWWHYQPGILAHVPDNRPNAMIPPGPNSSVGKVWISLSVPHYGIHGTKSPETIGYAQSAGCVRLTNWDVAFLSRRIAPGTPVRFRDTRRAPRTAPPAQPRPAGAAPAVRRDSARTDSARTRPAASPATAAPAPAAPKPAATTPAQASPAPAVVAPVPVPASPAPASPAPAPARPDTARPANPPAI